VISGTGAWMDAPRIQDAHYRLMAWWLRGLWSAADRTFHLTIAVEPATEPGPGPILVFSRHGGVANLTILLATLLLDYDLRPRVIMLDKFQWEPVLNALLNRIPNVFIRQGAVHREASIDAIGAVARGLGSHDAFVLFPEGHDFSLRRRMTAIDNLRQRGPEELAGKADQMANVLAPRIGGVTAAIAAAPGGGRGLRGTHPLRGGGHGYPCLAAHPSAGTGCGFASGGSPRPRFPAIVRRWPDGCMPGGHGSTPGSQAGWPHRSPPMTSSSPVQPTARPYDGLRDLCVRPEEGQGDDSRPRRDLWCLRLSVSSSPSSDTGSWTRFGVSPTCPVRRSSVPFAT